MNRSSQRNAAHSERVGSALADMVRLWCVKADARISMVKRQRRLRKLVPDAELMRRRAADEPLRALAADYNVSHTTLSRFFERPEVTSQVRQSSAGASGR